MATLLSINNYHYYRGGAETVFLEHNRMFCERNWQVVPFAMTHPRNLPSEWSDFFVDELEFGQAYGLPGKLRRLPKTIYSFEARSKLSRLLAATNPDIAHAHNLYHHISPSILGLLHKRSIPTVLTLHDLKIACPAYSMLANDGICERCKGGRLYNVVLHRCMKESLALSLVVMVEAVLHKLLGSYRNCVDRFVVPSRFFIDKFSAWGFPQEKFAHVPNFIEPGRYQPDFSPGQYFLYLGRLSREKGILTLIAAAARCGARVALVGTGPQTEELRQQATRLNANVDFMGYMTGSALHDAVRGARAVVLPSECYENAPMSVLEAYALGKPVLGARIGGIPELLQENITGQSFESGDADSLATALEGIARRPDAELEEMGRNGRRWVEADFNAARYADRILEIYRGLGVEART